MIRFKEHPLRRPLADEVHARPHLLMRAPVRVSHIAVMSGERGAEADRTHLGLLCRTFGVAPPASDAAYFSAKLGSFTVKWERHTEFASYLFTADGPFEQPFKEPVIGRLPPDWLQTIAGDVLAAIHVTAEPGQSPERSVEETAALFDNNTIVGSSVVDGRAKAWTDWKIHADGFGRVLIRDQGLNQRQLGRLVQRLVEIDTYRMMAMLAFPLAREARPKVAAAERELGGIVARLPTLAGVEDESAVLTRLSELAAEAEAIAIATNYRFSAARAYYGLVRQRVEDLREQRLEWMQPLGQFLYRRLVPAMETCENVAARQESLSVRISRASNLLRTRVDVALESQNRDLLVSMNRRAKLQLRLQQTVEGLSVVAISYYLVGLVTYAAKGVEAAGVAVNPELLAAVAIPFVVLLVWLGVRRLRRAITGQDGGG